MDRVRNEMRRKTGVLRELADQAKQGILRWFGRVKTAQEGLVKIMIFKKYKAGEGRSQIGWMGKLESALNEQNGVVNK